MLIGVYTGKCKYAYRKIYIVTFGIGHGLEPPDPARYIFIYTYIHKYIHIYIYIYT
jgi:hypothetical protein